MFWFASRYEGNPKNTLAFYTYLVNDYILPAIEEVELSKMSLWDIQSLYNELKEDGNLSDEKIRKKVRTIINNSLNKAFRWEMVAKNPAALVISQNVSKK